MARRRRSSPQPIVIGSQPQVTIEKIRGGVDAPVTSVTPPPGQVAIWSNEPRVIVLALLNTDGARPIEGGPRHRISERVGATSVPKYEGHDPIRMTVSIILDGYRQRRPVTQDLRDLHALGARLADGTLPKVRVEGPVPHAQLSWEIDGPIQWDDEPEPIRNHRGDLLRQPLTVTVIERVKDNVLQNSISRSRRSGAGARNGPRTTRVRAGENDFGDVSKRVFDTRSRAAEIARANGLSVGARLRTGQTLRLP